MSLLPLCYLNFIFDSFIFDSFLPNADAVLRWEFCLSVCLTVCLFGRLSVKRVHYDKTEEKSVVIFTPCERSFSLVFWEEWLVRSDPIYLKFWVNRPLLEQLLLITNRKSLTGFRLVQTAMTLDDLERRNSPYFVFFADFHFFAGQIRRSGWI